MDIKPCSTQLDSLRTQYSKHTVIHILMVLVKT